MSPKVSVVIPCLNEEKSLRGVLEEVKAAFSSSPYSFEIIVADNGSKDRTRDIARAFGAEVVSVPKRGYGAALMGGIRHAKGSVIVFGDADGTYDFKQSVGMVERLLQGDVAMVLGTRTGGRIESGAMPLLHRYVGTPLLSSLINLLFRARVSDCNTGLRCMYKDRVMEWAPTSKGMEFSSELIIHCLRAGDRIAEVPITLRRGASGRLPHLSTWKDGMRHLLVILSRAPHGFAFVGTLLLACSFFVAAPCIVVGPIRLGSVEIFDAHSLILAILSGFFGAQALCYSLFMDVNSTRPTKFNKSLLKIDEVRLLKIVNGLILMVVGYVSFIFTVWFKHGFNNLHYVRASLGLLYLVVVIGTLGFGLFMAQVYRRL